MLPVNVYEPTGTELTFEEISSLICSEYSKYYGEINYINRDRHDEEIIFSYKPINSLYSSKVFLYRPWDKKLIRYILESNRPDNTTIQHILIVPTPTISSDNFYGHLRDWYAGVLYIPHKYNYVYEVSGEHVDILMYDGLGRMPNHRELIRLIIEKHDNREEMGNDNDTQNPVLKLMAPVEYDPVLAQKGYCFSDKSGSYEGVNVFRTLHTNKVRIKIDGKWLEINNELLQEAENHVVDEYNMLLSMQRV